MAPNQNTADDSNGVAPAVASQGGSRPAGRPPAPARAREAVSRRAGRPHKAVRSMTGYAHLTADTPLGRVTVELRSVNSRFTDLQFRLGDDLRAIEPMLRGQIAAAVSR